MQPTRRDFIVTAGILGTVSLAGCLGGGGSANRDEAASEIEAAVAGQVIDIQIEAGPGVTLIDYITSASSVSGLGDEIREIITAYLNAIDDGHDLAHIEADVQNTEGVQLGEWEVTPQWVDRYRDGSLTATGVYQKAVSSVTTQ